MSKPDQLTEAQELAYESLLDQGGDLKWVPSDDIGHHQTIKALLVRKVIQVKEIDGRQHCALAGVFLDGEEITCQV